MTRQCTGYQDIGNCETPHSEPLRFIRLGAGDPLHRRRSRASCTGCASSPTSLPRLVHRLHLITVYSVRSTTEAGSVQPVPTVAMVTTWAPRCRFGVGWHQALAGAGTGGGVPRSRSLGATHGDNQSLVEEQRTWSHGSVLPCSQQPKSMWVCHIIALQLFQVHPFKTSNMLQYRLTKQNSCVSLSPDHMFSLLLIELQISNDSRLLGLYIDNFGF